MNTTLQHKQIPIVIAVIRNESGDLLLARRIDRDISEAHDTWEFAGGKIEFGETPEEAVIREAKEETGLGVEIIRLLPKILTNRWTKNTGEELQTIILCYECKVVGGQLHVNQFDSKIAELRYIPIQDLKNYTLLKKGDQVVELLNSNYRRHTEEGVQPTDEVSHNFR